MGKYTTLLGRIFFLFILIVVFISACETPPPPTSPSKPVDTEPPPPEPQMFPDLIIISATAENQAGSFFLKVSVQNQGQGLADGFDGECSYECVTGMTQVNNQDFLLGGYLMAGSTVSSLLQITPCQDTSIYFSCVVDPLNEIAETNENNNFWEGWVNMP